MVLSKFICRFLAHFFDGSYIIHSATVVETKEHYLKYFLRSKCKA